MTSPAANRSQRVVRFAIMNLWIQVKMILNLRIQNGFKRN